MIFFLFGPQVEIMINFFVVCTEIDQKEKKIKFFFVVVVPFVFVAFVVVALCSTDIVRFW